MQEIAETADTISEADKTLASVQLIRTARAAGLTKIDPEALGLSGIDNESLATAENVAMARKRKVVPKIRKIEELGRIRLMSAISLTMSPGFTGNAEEVAQIPKLLAALDAVYKVHSVLIEIRKETVSHGLLLLLFKANPRFGPTLVRLRTASSDIVSQIARLRNALSSAPYPFEHAVGPIDIGRYAVPSIPAAKQHGQVQSAGKQSLANVFALYARAVGQLVLIAERIEAGANSLSATETTGSIPRLKPEPD